MNWDLRRRVGNFGRHVQRYFDRIAGRRTPTEGMVQQGHTIESATSEMKSSAEHAQRIAKMINKRSVHQTNSELLSEMLKGLDKK